VTALVTPAAERRPWPSLGGQVCDFIRDYLVFGPGDRLGEPAEIDEETEWLIWRLYEVYPRGHALAGRRRFQRGGLSLRKGLAKTEKAAWITAVELHVEGPVRCTGWRRNEPIGGPVNDPYIPMLAASIDQTEDISYGALKAILENSSIARDFEITEGYVRRAVGSGEAKPVTDSPRSRDAARVSFIHFDETHNLDNPRLVRVHQTMVLNLPKLLKTDAWALETGNRGVPGSGSVAENTEDYARKVDVGEIHDSKLFYFGRWANEKIDISTELGLRAAIADSTGPYMSYTNTDGIIGLFQDPRLDRGLLEQRWLNRRRQPTSAAFDVDAWKRNCVKFAKDHPGYRIPKGARVVAGYDGSRRNDHTGLLIGELETGFIQRLGWWDPKRFAGEIPSHLVDIAIDEMFDGFDVWRLYADPWGWADTIARWAGKYGKDRVIEWYTNRDRLWGIACANFAEAIASGEVYGDPEDRMLETHIGNARKRPVNAHNDQNERLWAIDKERSDSELKIDLSAAAVLTWEAHGDAIAAGILRPPAEAPVYFVPVS
jgi:phage terminase large subunit-like protein